MQQPKVSVLLAVYNGAPWLEAAIRSVMDQTWRAWELIVVDNGSDDGSFDIASACAKKDERIKAYRLAEKGKNLAYNHAFAMSDGAYVTYFAADDILVADSLEKRVGILARKRDKVFSTCALRTQSDDPKYDGLTFPRDVTRPNFSGGVLLFSRDLAEMVFPLPTDLPNEDTWTQLHLRAFGIAHHYPEALYSYRIHGRNSFGYQVSYETKTREFMRRMRAYEMFFDRYGDEMDNPFIARHVALFVELLDAFREKRLAAPLLSRKFPLSMRLLFAYYASPLLYRVRAMLFRLMSGRVMQI